MKRIARQEALKLSLRITSRGHQRVRRRRGARSARRRRRAAAASASRPITFGSPQPQSSTWSSATSSETRPIESAAMPP